ncbi:hypothetical protein NC651_031099 [Populus alba x Populus x berolinensis]|nr:hypothetical protein NC651_031099 [Populus alba x Populus x berolinensis]
MNPWDKQSPTVKPDKIYEFGFTEAQGWSNYNPERRDNGLSNCKIRFVDLLDSEQVWNEYGLQRRETEIRDWRYYFGRAFE